MTPEAIQLLKDKPEECKEISVEYCRYHRMLVPNNNPTINETWKAFTSKSLRPDWEILSFKDNKGIYNLKEKDGWYRRDCGEGFPLVWCLKWVKDGTFKIHSVRRSDGEVFEEDTVTDKGTIKRFFIGKSGEMCVDMHNDQWYNLKHVTKHQPLFRSEDGIDVYNGDVVTPVAKKSYTICDAITTECTFWHGLYWYFSSRSAAEQWAEYNKPSISKKQLTDALNEGNPTTLLNHTKS